MSKTKSGNLQTNLSSTKLTAELIKTVISSTSYIHPSCIEIYTDDEVHITRFFNCVDKCIVHENYRLDWFVKGITVERKPYVKLPIDELKYGAVISDRWAICSDITPVLHATLGKRMLTFYAVDYYNYVLIGRYQRFPQISCQILMRTDVPLMIVLLGPFYCQRILRLSASDFDEFERTIKRKFLEISL